MQAGPSTWERTLETLPAQPQGLKLLDAAPSGRQRATQAAFRRTAGTRASCVVQLYGSQVAQAAKARRKGAVEVVAWQLDLREVAIHALHKYVGFIARCALNTCASCVGVSLRSEVVAAG